MSGGQLFALLDRAQNGDNEACEQVLLENSGLIWSIVRRYYGCGVETDDLYQLGCIGFIKAVKGFDLTYGTQFSTYAVPKIAGEIRRFLRDNGAIKVGRSIREQALTLYALRERLRQLAEREGNDALWRRLEAMDPETAKRIHPNNVGRVIRAIEVMTVSGKSIREHEAESLREPCPYHVIELGLRYHDRETLYGRINRRVDKMVEMGLTEEVKAAREQGLTATAAQAIGCKELYSWLDGKETQEEALEKLKQSTRRYAKRQLTWFGTDQRMRWIEPDTLAAGETPLDKAMEILEKEGMA